MRKEEGRPLQQGQKCFLVPLPWWKTWAELSHFYSTHDTQGAKEEGNSPSTEEGTIVLPPIDTSSLLEEPKKKKKKEKEKEEEKEQEQEKEKEEKRKSEKEGKEKEKANTRVLRRGLLEREDYVLVNEQVSTKSRNVDLNPHITLVVFFSWMHP